MKLLIFTNTNRGGRRSTQGDYWVLDLTFWNLRKLGGDADPGALMYAKNLRGNLLLMHGTGDDNVHYQNTEALINELIAYKKRFSVMIYPNRSHGLPEGENTQYHRYDMYTWYLNQNLPAGGR